MTQWPCEIKSSVQNEDLAIFAIALNLSVKICTFFIGVEVSKLVTEELADLDGNLGVTISKNARPFIHAGAERH